MLERENTAGGIPRHSDHSGYGIRDLHTFISGPAYARRLTDTALRAGARIRTGATVTGWADTHIVEITSPHGRERITARSSSLQPARASAHACPAYSRRPLGWHLHHRPPTEPGPPPPPAPRNPCGDRRRRTRQLVSRDDTPRSRLPTDPHDHQHATPEAYTALSTLGRITFRLPLETRTRVTRIIGTPRVHAIEIENLDTRIRRIIECDAVVVTGDWIPDNELARTAGLAIDTNTLGPLVDTSQATSAPGIYAIGNLTHPVDTADIAALDGVAAGFQEVVAAGRCR